LASAAAFFTLEAIYRGVRSMTLNLIYFARLKDTFGRGGETLDSGAASVAELLAELAARGGVWADELGAGRVFRVAVNQTMAGPDTVLAAGDEVAIFPPVTGG